MAGNPYGFDKKTSGDQIVAKLGANAVGKTFVVTGATSGIGLETVRFLLSAGASVVLCGRSNKSTSEAITKMEGSFPGTDLKSRLFGLAMDLSSLADVKRAATELLAAPHAKRLDVLINNAGIMAPPKGLSADGIEMQFAVNHVAHQLFTEMLLPRLRESAASAGGNKPRIVNVSSMANYLFMDKKGIFFDDLNADRSYSPWKRYGQSKLANILYAKQLQKRIEKDGLVAVSCHPGVIYETGLMRGINLWGYLSILGFPKVFCSRRAGEKKTVQQGTACTLYCALMPDAEIVKGGYYHDCEDETKMNPSMLNPVAFDAEVADKLVAVTNDLIKAKVGDVA